MGAQPQMGEMPQHLVPMLATAAKRPPEGEGWAAEVKWDGARALAYLRPGELRMESRLGNSLDDRFPEFAPLAESAPAGGMILDGEIVSFDGEGIPRFGLLQQRLQRLRPRDGDPMAVYLIFDLLFLDGRSTMELDYMSRRELLASLNLSGPNWHAPPPLEGDIAGLLSASRERGIEGLVLKRKNGIYRPGQRSRDWLKLKNVNRREFVIGGWLPGAGRRSGRLGSLLIGAWEEQPAEGRQSGTETRRLHYAGRVGTGFNEAWLDRLSELLAPLHRTDSPFHEPPQGVMGPPRGAIYVQPRLVAEIEYTEITNDGVLRHPSFKGLRDDKLAEEVLWHDI
jgi:bifunctional non-homologous end joining protein LigD